MITFSKHQFKYLAVFCSSIWQYFIQECGDVLFMYLANARLGVRYLHMDIISQFNKKIHPHPINSGVFDGDKRIENPKMILARAQQGGYSLAFVRKVKRGTLFMQE